jgi:predicted ArsR family transcriptional regulator
MFQHATRRRMSAGSLGARFFETTRGQMVSLLRRGARTVEDLAAALGLTDNAIRNHLATLERDGIIRQEGVRRGPRAGKPAVVYEMHPEAEPLFSKAYAPVLRTLVDVMERELPPEQTEAVLRQVGHQLAKSAGGQAHGDFNARVRAAAGVLTALGGDVDVIDGDGSLRIQGCGCPLASTVSAHPQVCRAVETLVGDLAGAPTQSHCEHGPRPRCRFDIQRDR